jgi:hypothetical protein
MMVRVSVATVYKIDGTPCEEPDQNQPDKVWRLRHTRPRRDSRLVARVMR